MKTRISVTAAVLLLAACGARQPQAGPQPAGSGRGEFDWLLIRLTSRGPTPRIA